MKLCMLMKNAVFHKHDKFHWSVIENELEIYIWNVHLSLKIFLNSFVNIAPGDNVILRLRLVWI